MGLAFDARTDLGNAAGVHALIVGVSAYRHLPGGSGAPAPDSFEMEQLSAPARSAFRLYEWLVEHQEHLRVPLATVRLLLSPSANEREGESGLVDGASACTLSDLRREARAWRGDASGNAGSVALFYFAGH